VAGFKDDKPFLGHLDMIGTAFEEDILATGFGESQEWQVNGYDVGED